jgi:peptidyl-prolyl isomerase D
LQLFTLAMSKKGASKGAKALNSSNCGDTPRCFLDIDIDDARAKHARAVAFVAAKNLAYGLSSNDIYALGGSERARVPELYASDWDWSQKGEMLMTLPPQRVVIECDRKSAPLAVANFVALCTGEKGKGRCSPARFCFCQSSFACAVLSSTRCSLFDSFFPYLYQGESGKALHYKGCRFHRVVSGFCAQTGDITTGTGAGGESIYNGKKFKDDLTGLKRKFDRGVVGMCNSGKHSNTSQFFFALGPRTAKLTGKHVAFGSVVDGDDVVSMIDAAGAADDEGKPTVDVIIADCGLLPPEAN